MMSLKILIVLKIVMYNIPEQILDQAESEPHTPPAAEKADSCPAIHLSLIVFQTYFQLFFFIYSYVSILTFF